MLPLLAAIAVAACAFDQAELISSDAPQVSADVGQLRVLSYDDDPTTDHWVDVVTPDPAVFEEGDSFRESDSRAAADDQPAEDRRLFTGVAPGRTLLVQFDEIEGDLLVWDLAVGDPDQGFSAATVLGAVDRPVDVAVGERFAVVRDAEAGAADPTTDSGDTPTVDLLARHVPEDGADLYVDVFLAIAPGRVELSYAGALVPVVVS